MHVHNGVLRLKVYVDLEIYAEGGFESLLGLGSCSGIAYRNSLVRPSSVLVPNLLPIDHITSLSISLRIGRLIALRPREIPITTTTNKRLSHKIV